MNFKKKEPTIILISGKARSGKSTVAKMIEDFLKDTQKIVVSPYTKYLKMYIEEITNTKITDTNKPRDLLQKISSDLIKKELTNPNLLITRQLEDLEVYSYFMDIVIIPDVRFKEEIEIIKAKFKNVISVRVIRNNYQSDLTAEQRNDITETALDNYDNYDYTIVNDGLTSLKEASNKIINDLNKKEGIL